MCAKSILFQEEQLRAGINIILTGFRHCSWPGHKIATDRADHKEAGAKRSERVRERELVKKPAFEKRERDLEPERTAKRRNLMSPVNKSQTLALKEMRTKRKK